MEYALYNGLRTAARPKLKAVCEHCGGEVIAKCGSKKIWHWAHTNTEACDSWYEPETAWHRNWKHIFGKNYSEIRIIKEEGYHIADVVNKDGIVFEFQNSSITSDVIAARENFYGEKLIWVINGESFKNNFIICDDEFTRDWNLKLLNEFESLQNYPSFSKELIIEDWRVKNEYLGLLLKQSGFIHAPDAHMYHLPLTELNHKRTIEKQLALEIKELYEKHKRKEDFKKGSFMWSHSRRSWEDAKRPVFIDFGEEYLYRITQGIGKENCTGIKILKEKFIEKYSV